MTVEKLISSRKSFSVLWMRFLQRIQRDSEAEIWVFEGKDDIAYYSPRIEAHYGIPPGAGIIIAEGKHNVLRLRTQTVFNPEYSSIKLAFFLDLDFDDKAALEGENTYITPTYSIENHYLEDDAIRRFLIEKLHLFEHEDQAELENVLQTFITWRNEISEILLPYCALLCTLRIHTPDSMPLVQHLKQNMFRSVINLQRKNEKISTLVHEKPLEICTRLLENVAVTDAILEEKMSLWRSAHGNNVYRIVRGKFLLPFLAMSLSVLIEDSNKRINRSYFSKRRPCSSQIREIELLSALTVYADTPSGLKIFLNKLRSSWREGANAQQQVLPLFNSA
jgi:Protein of unknown function (DUF4435)